MTGGSSGIGKSFIQLGQKLKPDLCFCNLSRRHPEENISPNPAKTLNHFACDLSHADEIARVARELGAFLDRAAPAGQLLLINNSGFGAFDAFADLDPARELQMIDLNVRAVVHLTGLLLPRLRSRGGAIINLASTVAFQPTPFAATYGATKAFVLHWTVALNEELRGTNVHALALCPGTTSTDFFNTAGVGRASGRWTGGMSPDAVVRSALRALHKHRSLVVPGWGNKAYTFAGARLPKAWAARIAGTFLSQRRASKGKT